MTREQPYDVIGRGYADHRAADRRIAAQLHAALGTARTVLNVGAGAGAYEPLGRDLVAVEPSWTMLEQRPAHAATAVQARAESLPFASNSFDAVMAVLTIHHWHDQARGASELRRVAGERVCILTWDPAASDDFWLVSDYFPDALALDRGIFPPLDWYEVHLGSCLAAPVPIPADCADGFFGAYWQRPHAYLDPGVRRAISTFSKIDDVDARIARLAHDLESGLWAERHATVLQSDTMDLGYRLITTR